MYKIININFIEYYSDIVDKDILEKYLMNSECNTPGSLKLVLKPGRDLVQEGPYILPPIRWVDSFEDNAEFIIICDVKSI